MQWFKNITNCVLFSGSLEDRVMVDFQQKALDHFQEQKAKVEKLREEEEKKRKIKDLGDGKVEFTDSLGRTRVADKAEVKDLMVGIGVPRGSLIGVQGVLLS